jgi:hypothetical protein
MRIYRLPMNLIWTAQSVMIIKTPCWIFRLTINVKQRHITYISAKKLGYTKKMWDGDKEPACCDEYWDDLDEEQRQAAMVLGYDKGSWDKEGAFAKCCVIL